MDEIISLLDGNKRANRWICLNTICYIIVTVQNNNNNNNNKSKTLRIVQIDKAINKKIGKCWSSFCI
ncbi:MAG: hypothetical protein N7Q72_06010, partial [Spiroplasma sp. Tabriz.8]|nr:hypothetical protein [Spiroplasma sp. Tabriz.8]